MTNAQQAKNLHAKMKQDGAKQHEYYKSTSDLAFSLGAKREYQDEDYSFIFYFQDGSKIKLNTFDCEILH